MVFLHKHLAKQNMQQLFIPRTQDSQALYGFDEQPVKVGSRENMDI